MSERVWCAVCVHQVHAKLGRFEGTQGLAPATTYVRGTAACGEHSKVIERLESAVASAAEAAIETYLDLVAQGCDEQLARSSATREVHHAALMITEAAELARL